MLNAQLSNNTGASCAWNNSSVCSSECSFCCAGCAPLAARIWSRDKKLGERSPALLIYTAWLYLRRHASLRGVYQKIFLAPQKDDRLAQRPNAIRLERLLTFSRVCPLDHASRNDRARVYLLNHMEKRETIVELTWHATLARKRFSSTQKWIFYVERHGDSSISPWWSDDRMVTTWLGIFVRSVLSNSIEQNGSYRNVLSMNVLLVWTKRIIHNSVE